MKTPKEESYRSWARTLLAISSHIGGGRHHSASRDLIIAGLSGFLTLIQSRDGPER